MGQNWTYHQFMLHGNLGLSHLYISLYKSLSKLKTAIYATYILQFEPAWLIEFVVTILSYRWCSQIAATWKDQVSVDKQPYGTLHGR